MLIFIRVYFTFYSILIFSSSRTTYQSMNMYPSTKHFLTFSNKSNAKISSSQVNVFVYNKWVCVRLSKRLVAFRCENWKPFSVVSCLAYLFQVRRRQISHMLHMSGFSLRSFFSRYIHRNMYGMSAYATISTAYLLGCRYTRENFPK